MKSMMQRGNKRSESLVDFDDNDIGDSSDSVKLTKGSDDVIKRIRHVKCKVIQLAREQIKRFNDRQAEIEARMLASNTFWNRIRKRGNLIIVGLIIGLLVWMSLIYGALLGASLCSSGRSCFPFIQSFSHAAHQHQIKHSLF